MFTAEIEVVEKDVEKTIEFPIPGANVTMTVEVDSTSTYGLVTITMSSLDKSSEKINSKHRCIKQIKTTSHRYYYR